MKRKLYLAQKGRFSRHFLSPISPDFPVGRRCLAQKTGTLYQEACWENSGAASGMRPRKKFRPDGDRLVPSKIKLSPWVVFISLYNIFYGRNRTMSNIQISDHVRYIGVDDKTIQLFESQYDVPNGVS